MNKILKYMTICAALICLAAALSSCGEKEYYPRPSYLPEGDKYYELTAEEHPRLLMKAEDFDALKERIASGQEKNLTMLHDLIMRVTDYKGMATSELEFVLDASQKRILTVSRNAILRIFLCAYAYRMTGDEKYLTHAEKDINTVCSFTSWNAKKHFLDAGEMATAVAFGYDWLYNELSEETKAKAREAIQNFAFQPAFDHSWNLNFYTAQSNWNQVCNGGLVCAALAIYESNQKNCQKIIDDAISSNADPMKTMYSPDGNYMEGYSYWCYGTTFQCLMMAALESVLGTDFGLGNIKGFSQTGRYMQYMEGVNNRVFNYSDNGGYASFLLPQWYFAQKYSDESLLYSELKKLPSLTGAAAGTEERLLPMVVSFIKDVNLDNCKAPSAKIWSGNGMNPIFIVKTGWENSDDDKYLAVKAGRAKNSHGHMDAGSFVYDALGVRWVTDLGGTSYTAAEVGLKALGGNLWTMSQESMRWDICVLNNKFHSTLTVNDEKHQIEYVSTVEETFEKNGEIGGTVDITPALSTEVTSARRTVKIVGDKDLVVIDAIRAKDDKTAAVRWNIMTQAQPAVEDGCIVLKLAGKTMYLTASCDIAPVQLKIFEMTKKFDFDTIPSGVYAVGFETVIPEGKSAMLTAKLSPEK